MRYRVDFLVQPSAAPSPDLARLKRLARWVLASEGADPGEVAVLLTGDEQIRTLNRQYLGRDRPTDVLAFSFQEGAEAVPGWNFAAQESRRIGDVVISLERAREQAEDVGHPYPREVAFLLIHGLLHLLGYEDDEEVERRRMLARQEQLLAAFEARRSVVGSFQAAFAGLGNLVGTQRNWRIHLVFAAATVLAGACLGLRVQEWALLVLTIALVLVAEALNTAIEALVDLASPENRPLARRAKDVAAAGVLLAAALAVAVGLLLFVPRLWELLR